MTTIPEGYWIERSEEKGWTRWFVFTDRTEVMDDDAPGEPLYTVTHHLPDDGQWLAPGVHWVEVTPAVVDTPDAMRVLAATLVLAADEADGKLDR